MMDRAEISKHTIKGVGPYYFPWFRRNYTYTWYIKNMTPIDPNVEIVVVFVDIVLFVLIFCATFSLPSVCVGD